MATKSFYRYARSKKFSGEVLKILLVEDNPDHAELILRCFFEHKVPNEIYHVDDGEKALEFLFQKGAFSGEETSMVPNLILLDLRLPKTDGLEVLKRVKTSEKYSTVPVVILTSSEEEKDVARAYQYFANSYLVKPTNYDDFKQLMNDIGFYWLGWNHTPLKI